MGESNNIKIACLLVVFTLTSIITVSAQSGHINEESSITRMMKIYANKYKSIDKVKAWRIQVAALIDRRDMEKEKIRFENVFPYHRLVWKHDNPYYILTISDVAYLEKLDALHLLHKIKNRYPSAILVLDDVRPEQLLDQSDY